MKKILLSSALCLGLMASKATIHTITISGFTFSPATTTAMVGDTVAWVLTGVHTATEVSSATWTANGNTPLSGGFNFNAASTTSATSWIQVTAPGTRYFVCSPHVSSMHMKGQINVSGTTGIEEQTQTVAFNLYPNPASDFVNLNVSGADNEMVTIDVLNLLGSKVMDLGGKQPLMNGAKRIDISALPKGVYFLNIVADNRTRTSVRFVKQ